MTEKDIKANIEVIQLSKRVDGARQWVREQIAIALARNEERKRWILNESIEADH